MNIFNFILENWDGVMISIAIIAILIVCIIKREKNIIFKMLFALVTEAEKTYGKGTGELKLSSVISSVYSKLPSAIKTILPIKVLEAWIEAVLLDAKKKWSENANIATYIMPHEDMSTIKSEQSSSK